MTCKNRVMAMADPYLSQRVRAVLDVARTARGYMPDVEGLALFRAANDVLTRVDGPVLEIGTYCGKSACYLAAAAEAAGQHCITVDHHRGSEEMQPGWEHHDDGVVDARSGRIDSLPEFRRTIEAAGLEATVVALIGDSPALARYWHQALALLFIDGGHSEHIAMADYLAWEPFITPGGVLAIHDVFADPVDGGQGPFRVWERAVADGFEPWETIGSLRTLRR
ncbi:MAG: class I SAM-dependent methyltransferase [Acidimicrobiia bacterium]